MIFFCRFKSFYGLILIHSVSLQCRQMVEWRRERNPLSASSCIEFCLPYAGNGTAEAVALEETGYSISCLRKCTLILLPRKNPIIFKGKYPCFYIFSDHVSELRYESINKLFCYSEHHRKSQQASAQQTPKSLDPKEQLDSHIFYSWWLLPVTWNWAGCPVVQLSQGREHCLFSLDIGLVDEFSWGGWAITQIGAEI